MNIINIGGWYVGNSAVLDWMDGFEELSFIKGEVNILRLENGIMDMISCSDKEKKLKMIQINIFSSYKMYYVLVRRSVGSYTKHLFKNRQFKFIYDRLSFYKHLIIYLKNYEKKIKNNRIFDEIDFWKDWVEELAKIDTKHNKYKHVIHQNPFFYDETYDDHKDIWPQLFRPYKMMFVHRDPLDQFADIVKDKSHLITSWPRFHGGTEDMHPADRFLTIAKKLYIGRLRMAENCTENDLVIFSFEDFLQNHERVTDKLKSFLDITSQRNPNNKRFLLEQSMKNIGKGKDSEEVKELLKGKSYVIDELNEYREKLINHKNAI